MADVMLATKASRLRLELLGGEISWFAGQLWQCRMWLAKGGAVFFPVDSFIVSSGNSRG